MISVRVVAAASFAISAALVVACSSFSGSDASGPGSEGGADEAGTADAISGGSGPDAAGPDVDAGDPCLGAAPAKEIAGLYVVGGQGPINEAGAELEPPQVLRAPILCDHTLGPWQRLGAQHSVASAAVAALGGGVLIVGGQTIFGFDNYVWYAPFNGNQLGGFASFAADSGVTHVHRTMSASNGQVLVVAGGEGPAAATTAAVTLWQVAGNAPATFGSPQMLPNAASRGAAAMVGDRVFVIGGGIIQTAKVDGMGVMSPWVTIGSNPAYDLSATAYNGHFYSVGGGNNTKDLVVYTPKADGTLQGSRTFVLPFETSLAAVSAYRDTLYVVGTDYAPYRSVAIIPLVGDGIDTPTMGPDLPEDRYNGVAFVRPN